MLGSPRARIARIKLQLQPTAAPKLLPTSFESASASAAAAAAASVARPSPELLAFNDGSEVSAATWNRRRTELEQAIIHHEFGGMPPAHESVTIHSMASSTFSFHSQAAKTAEFRRYEIRTTFAGGRETSVYLSLWIPPSASKEAGPRGCPVLLDFDGCWRYFNDHIIESCLLRGNIAASIDRCDAASDNKDDYRNTGIRILYHAYYQPSLLILVPVAIFE